MKMNEASAPELKRGSKREEKSDEIVKISANDVLPEDVSSPSLLASTFSFIKRPWYIPVGLFKLWLTIIFDLIVLLRFTYLAFWGNPGAQSVRPICKIIEDDGYHVETHTVITRDGYHLVLFRVRSPSAMSNMMINPTNASNQSNSLESSISSTTSCYDDAKSRFQREGVGVGKGPVLLWHGLLDDAFTWITQGSSRSLAYMLCDKGYDVWLGNNRGNCYSQNHDYLRRSNPEFWAFTFDELAKFDLPDTLSYIQQQVQRDQVRDERRLLIDTHVIHPRRGSCSKVKIAYVGHSEGTTQMFAMLATCPELASKLSCFTALGPVARVGNLDSYVLKLLGQFYGDRLCWALGLRRGFMLRGGMLEQQIFGIISYVCPSVVQLILTLLCGPPRSPMKRGDTMSWGAHEPGGSSVLNIAHWCQAVRHGDFRRFDYGCAVNLKRYGSKVPPIYDVSAIPRSLPKLLIRGTNDALVTSKDIEWLCKQLGTAINEIVNLKGWNHTDYMWEPRAATVVYPRVIDFIEQYHSVAK